MSSKFGNISQRLIGAIHYFVPDGSQIGTVEIPAVSGPGKKPANPEDWLAYFTGRIKACKYNPTTAKRDTEAFSPNSLTYDKTTEVWNELDAFEITQVEYPATLYDQLMFGLESTPVDGVAQPVFANPVRYIDGWSRMVRHNEDKSIHTVLEVRVRLSIMTHPDDQNERGNPVFRIEILKDTDPAMQTVTINPTLP